MPPRIDLVELHEHFRRGDDLIVIHYGCENLYTAKDHPASVSCVAYCRVVRAEAGSFSVVDTPEGTDPSDAELQVLKRYFAFLERNGGAAFVHWNMSKPDYGFSALEARYKFLTADDAPYQVPRDRTYDLDDLITYEYGSDYAPHPRLISVAVLNGLRRHHALAGKDEADRFEAGDHGSIRRSIDEKARWIAVLGESFLAGSLKTVRSVGRLSYAGGKLDAVQTIIQLGHRFLYVQRELRTRRAGRPTFEVKDEYDAQDLFRALLRIFFDDVRPEDYVPTYAGASSRVDFVIPPFELAIELKHSRQSMDAKSLGEELLADVARYGSRADIRHLVCLVFDHEGQLSNPRGLEADLSREATREGLAVSVVILDR